MILKITGGSVELRNLIRMGNKSFDEQRIELEYELNKAISELHSPKP